MTSLTSRRALLGVLATLFMYSLIWSHEVSAAEWRVALEVSNGACVHDTILFGVHPNATPGIDPALGEVGLPPWPPSSLFDVRFLVPASEGARLDLRDTTHTERFHTIKWQVGQGGYPVTVRWDIASLPYAALRISDGYGGVFIPPINMFEVDSLQVPPAMSYITQLTVDVMPGAKPNASPCVDAIPGATVFVGQQFPEYYLDDYVSDPDTPDGSIQWFVTGNQALIFEIDQDRILRIRSPRGWHGNETVTFTARDSELHTGQTTATFSVIRGGLPAWTVPISVRNGAQESRTVHFGIHPDGSDAIDPALGEVALPPWPPSSAFDARFLLPDALTWSVRDIRKSAPDSISYHLNWQAGAGGYPVTVSWPPSLPLGEFTIQDEMGGVFIPPTSMADTTEINISETFITGLLISARAVVDTTPPVGPEWLVATDSIPGVSVSLTWPECTEQHFAYYEILYDTVDFYTEANFVWDWTEDSALMNIATTSTTVLLPSTVDKYRFRIRAWDTFGNVGQVSNLTTTAVPGSQPNNPSPPPRLRAWPNPFHDKIVIWFSVPGARDAIVSVHDVAGRQVARFTTRLSSGLSGQVLWDGRDETGSVVASGIYLFRLEAPGYSETRKIVLVR